MASLPIIATIFRKISLLFLFVCLIISFPVSTTSSTRRPTSHCFNEALCLSSNLACSPTRSHNLVSLINQALKPIQIDLYTETPTAFPWSYTPICTETLSGLNSKLCVYTNTTFSSSRGISIFTTPQIASEFFALRPFQDPKALNGINNPTGPWTTRPTQGKGIGMVASLPLSRGDLITAYTPLLLVNIGHPLPTKIMERFLRQAVDQLPSASREAYLSLATQFDNPDVVVQDVLKSNAFEIQVGGTMHLAVFPEPARLNHDCAPNAQYHLDPERLEHYVHATREIAMDEELTISYTSPFQPYAVRQQLLHDGFHFTCSCSRCTEGEASDAALAEITSLQQVLGDWNSRPSATPEQAEQLIQLYEKQGLHAFLDTAYGYAALTYNAAGDVKGARKYAGLAAKAVAMKDGLAAPDFRMWEMMIDDPKGHWSWRRRSY